MSSKPTLKEVTAAVSVLERAGYDVTKSPIQPPKIKLHEGPEHVYTGQAIVVLDRGFVYVGDVTREGDMLAIANAKNIRVWGTSKGLGELVKGPTTKTVLDAVGTVQAPFRAVITVIPCSGF